MRLDEWQKYIDSEFLEERKAHDPSVAQLPEPSPAKQAAGERTDRADSRLRHDDSASGEKAQSPVTSTQPFGDPTIVSTEMPDFASYLPPRTRTEPEGDISEPFDARSESSAAPSALESAITDERSNSPGGDGLASLDAETGAPRRQAPGAAAAILQRLHKASYLFAPGQQERQEKRRLLIERLLDPLLTTDEAAVVLDVSPATVRRYVSKGTLAPYSRTDATDADAERSTRKRFYRLSDVVALSNLQTTRNDAEGALSALGSDTQSAGKP